MDKLLLEKEVFIFGTGFIGIELLNKIKDRITIKGFFDNDFSKIGEIIRGYKVFEIKDFVGKDIFIIIASSYKREISQQLKKFNFQYIKDYIYFEQVETDNQLFVSTNLFEIEGDFNYKTIYKGIDKRYLELSTDLINEEVYLNKLEKVLYPSHSYDQDNNYYVKVQQGYVSGENSNIFTSKGELIEEFSYLGHIDPSSDLWNSRKIIDYKNDNLFLEPYFIEISGKMGVTSTIYSENNYFHWFFEELPRFYILNQSKEEIDYYLSSFSGQDYQIETLKMLGIDIGKILNYKKYSLNNFLKCDCLVVPHNPNNNFGYYSRWILEFLKGLFKYEDLIDRKSPKKIYISRRDTNKRNITNELDLISVLNKYGYEEIVLTGLSLKEKAKLFFNADSIIAPYGAGLTNIIFCKNTARVLEIFNPSRVTSVYYALAKQFNLNYQYFEAYTESHSINANISDLKVDLEKIQEFL